MQNSTILYKEYDIQNTSFTIRVVIGDDVPITEVHVHMPHYIETQILLVFPLCIPTYMQRAMGQKMNMLQLIPPLHSMLAVMENSSAQARKR